MPGKRFSDLCTRRAAVMLALIILVAVSARAPAQAAGEKILYSFQQSGTGAGPEGLVADKDGNLYGLSGGGAGNCFGGCGIVFELTPPAIEGDAWTESTLYAFDGGDADGAYPSSIIFDQQGNLYGTTSGGGPQDRGTVFRLSPPATPAGAWSETVLYIFPANGNRGADPRSLVFGPNGALYGTTQLGGTSSCIYASDCGVVFSLKPPAEPGGSWTESVLHSFGSGNDGLRPVSSLIFDSAGALYGTTLGASSGQAGGTVFQLVKNEGKWTENILFTFPLGGITNPEYIRFGSAGQIYGVASGAGGADHCFPAKCGGIFELTPPSSPGESWTETTLYAFTGAGDGAYPSGHISFDKAGNIYGIALRGGLKEPKIDFGTAFELSPPATSGGPWTETTLHHFRGFARNDGELPTDLIFVKGKFYGTTNFGGADEGGTVFRLVVH